MKNVPLYDVRHIGNVKEMLDTSASIYAERTAFLVKNKEGADYKPVSYKQFKSDVEALGTALLEMGLKGEKIALIGENRYEWTVSYLAVINGTGIAVPLDKELPQNEIEMLIARSGASAVIFSGKYSGQMLKLSQKLSNLKHLIDMDSAQDRNNLLPFREVLSKGYELIESGNRSFKDAQIDNDSLSVLLFTSGTTDSSKAVMLSHRNISSNLMAMCSMLYIGEDDIFLSVLPIHHTYECTCGFLCPIYRGATVAYCEGLRHIVKNLQESRATVMLGVPLIFEAIYKRIWDQASKKPETARKLKIALKLSNTLRLLGINLTKKLFAPIHDNFGGHVRLFISGAAGIDPSVAKGFRDFGIHFVQGYGLTECSPIAALNRDIDFRDNAAGIPLPNLEVRIADPNYEGIGEVAVKGPSVMLGYYNNEELTGTVLKDGWFYTGDLGFMDKDKFIYITGRKKNVIITKNGKNIYPEEIESLLNKSPYILESLVYAKDDEDSGDLVVSAVIVPDTERMKEEFTDKDISDDFIQSMIKSEIRSINGNLVNYKHIKDFNIRQEEFSKTTTRKIKRYVESNKAF